MHNSDRYKDKNNGIHAAVNMVFVRNPSNGKLYSLFGRSPNGHHKFPGGEVDTQDGKDLKPHQKGTEAIKQSEMAKNAAIRETLEEFGMPSDIITSSKAKVTTIPISTEKHQSKGNETLHRFASFIEFGSQSDYNKFISAIKPTSEMIDVKPRSIQSSTKNYNMFSGDNEALRGLTLLDKNAASQYTIPQAVDSMQKRLQSTIATAPKMQYKTAHTKENNISITNLSWNAATLKNYKKFPNNRPNGFGHNLLVVNNLSSEGGKTLSFTDLNVAKAYLTALHQAGIHTAKIVDNQDRLKAEKSKGNLLKIHSLPQIHLDAGEFNQYMKTLSDPKFSSIYATVGQSANSKYTTSTTPLAMCNSLNKTVPIAVEQLPVTPTNTNSVISNNI